METKLELRPKVGQFVTGLDQNKRTYPAIFIKNNGGSSEPFQFGGTDRTMVDIRMVVLSNSAFTADAVCGIFKDKNRSYMRIIDQEDLPFDAFGGSISGFNYEGIATGNNLAYINDVTVFKPTMLGSKSESLNKNVYSSFVDFELEVIRNPKR